MSIIRKIVEWAERLEGWKQDAARRVLEQREYTKQDVEELTDILLCENNLIKESKIEPRLIERSQISAIDDSAKHKIILKGVKSSKNVNNLSPEGELSFASTGLTIIYGENGSGKSGYSRILKKCCKAKDTEDVLRNAYKTNNGDPAEAIISYSYNGGSEQEIRWVDGKYKGSDLEYILVHDSKCGKIQVNDNNELVYLPDGADVFEKLVLCFDNIKEEIEKKHPKKTLPYFNIANDTEAHKTIREITNTTNKKEISTKIEFTKEKKNRLLKIKKHIADADKDMEKTIESEERSVRELHNFLTSSEDGFLNSGIKEIRRLIEGKKALEKALDEMAAEMYGEELIEGTGNTLWRAMYKAAEEFVADTEHADHKHLAIDGKCVLCQQFLDKAAKARMKTFSKFAEEELKNNLDEISRQIDSNKDKFIKLAPKISHCQGLMAVSFSSLSEDQCKEITTHLGKLESVRAKIVETLEECEDKMDEPLLLTSKISLIKDILSKIEAKKKELQRPIDQQNLVKLRKEQKELEALKEVSSKKDIILEHVDYLKKYDEMIKKLNTAFISNAETELVTKFLERKFGEALSCELKKLGTTSIPLYVRKSTRKGQPMFQLQLRDANIPQGHNIDSILSEGEQKVASLAGFFAEIATAEHRNGIILDDPVTSLDEKFRTKIAERLVQEAKSRQVIIFTHDIAFLFELQYFSESYSITHHVQNVRKNSVSGLTSGGLPWHAKNVEGRIESLKKEASNLDEPSMGREKLNEHAGLIYSRLRETWERLIEEVLFNKVLTRFSPEVKTMRLEEVSIEDSDYKTIYNEMKNCSRHMVGHDTPPTSSGDKPSANDIMRDIKKIESYKKTIKGRQKEKRSNL